MAGDAAMGITLALALLLPAASAGARHAGDCPPQGCATAAAPSPAWRAPAGGAAGGMAAAGLRIGGPAMGTRWNARLVAGAAQAATLQRAADAELERLTAQMSAWRADSALSRFNRADAGSWHALPEDLFRVLAHAQALAEETGGAFDPTVGPLVEAWGFGTAARRNTPPPATLLDAARARVGWQRLELDHAAMRALQPGGVRIDVSAIAPGYAVDRLAQLFEAAGVRDYLLELGGEMRSAGTRADGSAWRVLVEHPGRADAAGLASGQAGPELVIELRDAAAGSSGDYREGFVHAGRRYPHTIDPRTGEPVRHALAAVTVLHATAMQADALAAALMVLGPEAGWAFAQRRGIDAAFTLRTAAGGFERRLTPGLAARALP